LSSDGILEFDPQYHGGEKETELKEAMFQELKKKTRITLCQIENVHKKEFSIYINIDT
jgi:hypothetical protein